MEGGPGILKTQPLRGPLCGRCGHHPGFFHASQAILSHFLLTLEFLLSSWLDGFFHPNSTVFFSSSYSAFDCPDTVIQLFIQ